MEDYKTPNSYEYNMQIRRLYMQIFAFYNCRNCHDFLCESDGNMKVMRNQREPLSKQLKVMIR